MSDELIEKMCEVHWDTLAPGQERFDEVQGRRWRDQDEQTRIDFRYTMRASLAILSKPENISWPMRKALWDALDLDRYSSIKFNFSDAESDVLLNQGIAAAIGSLIK